MSIVVASVAPAQQQGAPKAAAVPLPFVTEDVLAQRDFPLLTAVLHDDEMRRSLAEDAELKALAAERWESAAQANPHCIADVHCKVKALAFTDAQIDATDAAMRRLYTQNAAVHAFVQNKLTPAEAYGLDARQNDAEHFAAAWTHAEKALNRIMATYAEGAKPRYPEIDSMTYPADTKTYAALITIMMDDLASPEQAEVSGEKDLFFIPALRFATRLLQSNARDEAGRFWPLEKTENAAAVKQVKRVWWSSYAYTAIVVPGAGNEVAGVEISPWGRERLRLAVAAYRVHKAPYLLVSGGYVHPSQTPYCEALGMKRYLIQVYGIPESAILVDPYARHTTTNLRNAAREVFDYGLPADKPMLIVSDKSQTDYIANSAFVQRNQEELGYQPVRLGKRLSPTELEAVPLRESLLIDAMDPLDP